MAKFYPLKNIVLTMENNVLLIQISIQAIISNNYYILIN
ncbi:hypothetical protein MNBD_GAMMA22-279 [hydrothermal vent metagenome]|uniref:Uncharacterized protein n=1 Tax=hydrothermal vent metagenome TaxID=652676 RepID=A0A3B0ZXT3_9ZZZZ